MTTAFAPTAIEVSPKPLNVLFFRLIPRNELLELHYWGVGCGQFQFAVECVDEARQEVRGLIHFAGMYCGMLATLPIVDGTVCFGDFCDPVYLDPPAEPDEPMEFEF